MTHHVRPPVLRVESTRAGRAPASPPPRRRRPRGRARCRGTPAGRAARPRDRRPPGRAMLSSGSAPFETCLRRRTAASTRTTVPRPGRARDRQAPADLGRAAPHRLEAEVTRDGRALGSKPRPSSRISRSTCSRRASTRTHAVLAPACLTTLASASRPMPKSWVSACGESGRRPPGPWTSIVSPSARAELATRARRGRRRARRRRGRGRARRSARASRSARSW